MNLKFDILSGFRVPMESQESPLSNNTELPFQGYEMPILAGLNIVPLRL